MRASVKPGPRILDWEKQLSELGVVVWCFESSGSTMDLGREVAVTLPAGASGLVLARVQQGGRGRQGRQWIATECGFYATYIFTLPRSPDVLAGLSLAVGVVLAEVLGALGAEVSIKWPNDVLDVSGDKLAGILVEAAHVNEVTTVLVGIGVNLSGEPPGVAETTSVQTMTGQKIEPLQFARLLSPLLRRGWTEFVHGGFSRFQDRFLARAAFLNRPITLDHGEVKESGLYKGVDLSGALQLELDGEMVTRSSGEVKNFRPIS